MKGKATSVKLFFAGTIVGLSIGAATTYKVSSQPDQRKFTPLSYEGVLDLLADQYMNVVMSETHNAILLRQGRQKEVSERIEMNLPTYVRTIDVQYTNHRMATRALRNIRFFYQKNNIAIPANIQPILAAIPADAPLKATR